MGKAQGFADMELTRAWLDEEVPAYRHSGTRVRTAWGRRIELALLGCMPYWDEAARSLPTSAWADIYPDMWKAMANADMPMTYDDFQGMTTYFRLAHLNIAQGTASEESWSCLALGVNLAMILAEKGYGIEWMPLIDEAKESLHRAAVRGHKSGAWRMDGPGLGVIADVLDVFEAQLEMATRGEIVAARDEVMRRMDQQIAEQQAAAGLA